MIWITAGCGCGLDVSVITRDFLRYCDEKNTDYGRDELPKEGNIGLKEVFFTHKFSVGILHNTKTQTSDNVTRNIVDTRLYKLTSDEKAECISFLGQHIGKSYDLFHPSMDEFVWGLEQTDEATGFEQYTTALEMTMLATGQQGKKQVLSKRTAVFSEVRSLKFYIVDCFAEEKYQGNELLVLKADRLVTDEEQQKIAREINFSETAFILSDKQGNGGYDVRIWTPNVGEVPFAGHPTLGTAFVIYQCMEQGQSDLIKLNLKAGQIPVAVTSEGLTMSQNPPTFGKAVDRQEIAEIFGLEDESIREDYPVQWVSTGLESVIVPLKDRQSLAHLKIDREMFEQYILRHPENNCNHLFFVETGNCAFAARCLMEDYMEDPATGSANGDLAGYLLQHDYFGKSDISYTVIQGEDMGRKSVLHIQARKTAGDWTIEVGGRCHIVASGEWG